MSTSALEHSGRETINNPATIRSKSKEEAVSSDGMKILFVDQTGSVYGSEKGLLALLGKPRPIDFTAVLACPKGELWDATEGLVSDRCEMEFGGYGWLRRPDWQLRFLLRFTGIVRRHRPDLIVINFEGNVPLLVLGAKLMRRPVVRMLKREVHPADSDSSGYKMHGKDRWSFLSSTGVVCISGAVEAQLRQALQAGPEFPAVTLFDPQEIVQVTDETARLRRQQHGLPLDAPVVGQFSRVHPIKGIDTLIKAAPLVLKSIPNARFMIVGDSDGSEFGRTYHAELKQLVKEMQVAESFIWAGYVADPMVSMAACDLTVLPTRAEGLGRVVLESWAVGRPVVASDTDGPGEVIRLSGGGLLHPIDDHKKLAECIVRVLQDRKERERLANLGREWTRENCDPVNYREQFIRKVSAFINA